MNYPNYSQTESNDQQTSGAMAKVFAVGINQKIVGKCDPERLSYSGAWTAATLSLAGLSDHIGQGHPWMPSRLDAGQRRYQHHANHAEVLALDIDGGMAIAQALGHPVIAAHCGLGIESASSSPELNKYRLVFVLPQPVDGWQTIRICNRYLAHLVGTADPACKDASRYFFGAPGRTPFLLNESATLPASFVEDAIAWHDAIEAQERARAEQARRAWEDYQRQNPGQDTDALILDALNAISPDCDYNTWIAIGMALAGMGDQWLSVWDSWSAGSSSYKSGECDHKWKSFRGKRPAPEVIFGIAKNHGWRFPRRLWLDRIADRLTRRPAPVDRRRGRDEATNLQAYRERKQAQKAQEQARWLDDVVKLAGAPAGADRAVIAAAFDRQHKLSGEPVVGTFDPITWPEVGQRKLSLADGQKMTRKTSVFLRSVVDQGRARGLSGIIYNPTRILSRRAAQELGILTIDQYLAMDEDKRPPRPWLSGCPESAWKLDGMAFDVVSFDEGNEGIPRTQSGILGNHPYESRQVVKQQLINAPLVVLAQDKLYRPTVRAVQRWGHFDASQVEKHQRRRPATEMAIYLYLDNGNAEDMEAWDGTAKEKPPQANQAFYTWFDGIARKIEAGKRVIIPCGSEAKGRAIHRALRSRFPECRGQVLDGKYTPAGIRAQFADDPTGFAPARRLNWLIFTPVFNSGVSIEGTYFDAQYEYVRAFESASSASQRGERNRDAIRGDKIKERHVYIASRGIATMPDPAVFTPDYWQTLLGKAPNTDAINLAQQMGCNQLIERITQDTPEDWLELPEFMAIEAREVYFRLELLTQEWEGNGWAVAQAPLSMEAVKAWSDNFYLVDQSIKSQKSRALAKANGKRQEGDEPAGAIEATKHHKWELSQLLGDYAGLSDAKWIEAWVIDSGNTGLSALRIRSLVRIAHESPELWAEANRQFALSIVAKAGTVTPADLPCTYREFDAAKLLATCPGLYPVIARQVERWHKLDSLVLEAAGWSRNHAQELGRLSSTNNRIRGFQFTDKTPAVKAFHKLLDIVGLETDELPRQGTGDRLWEYRLKAADDIRAKLAQKQAQQDIRTHDLERQLTRHETEAEVFAALDQVLRANIERLTPKWDQVEAELLEKHSSRTSVEIDQLTEVLDVAPYPPGTLVRKIGVNGWRGPVLDVTPNKTALVAWFGDPEPTEVPISLLELAA